MDRKPDAAEEQSREELLNVKRKAAAVAEEPVEQELEHPRSDDGGDGRADIAEAAPREQSAGPDDGQQHERERARRERQHRADSETPAPSLLQRPDREQREGDRERKREGRGADDPHPEDGERPRRELRDGPPLPEDDERERERGRRDRGEREDLIPKSAASG